MKHLRHHIAVIRGNFAGLNAAIKLSTRHAVTVIDPSVHFEWIPNIHEILSSVKTPQGLQLDRAAIVEQAGHRFLQDRVTELHPAKKRLLTVGGEELSFDACIVAVGARWKRHDIPGLDRHALPCRGIADVVIIEQRLRALARQGQPLHMMIVGGGISGIEALRETLHRYRDVPSLSVEVVEVGERLLHGQPPVLDADLRRVCHPHAVRFRTGAIIASVSVKGLILTMPRGCNQNLLCGQRGWQRPSCCSNRAWAGRRTFGPTCTRRFKAATPAERL